MRLLDISFTKPEENLAFDEILLDGAQAQRSGETLRFWESPMPFVVLGVSQILRQEVYEKNCLDDHIRIARRCSAGGCVFQGPGCLNFSLVLEHDRHPEIQTVRGSYCYVLGRLSKALQRYGVRAHHKGVSDLAVAGKKVSGSAQKRRRRCILHHGTLLYHVNMDLMDRYLREPADRPQYRGERTHRGFLRTLPLDPHKLRLAVCEAFDAQGPPKQPYRWELLGTKTLAEEKYAARDWVWRR